MGSSDHAHSSPLTGVRVLTFGTFVAGNVCDTLLAELGAEVVKIEASDRPEALRDYFSVDHPAIYEPSGAQTTAVFAGLARSTRGICVNMKDQVGVEVFRRLVQVADVLVENLGPGQMQAWGCGHDELRVVNPTLVYLSISGYGRSGPLASYRAYASNISNYLGLSDAWVTDGTHLDYLAAVHAASAAVAGIATSRQYGNGVYVDLAQTEAGAAIMAPLYLASLAGGAAWSARPNEVPGAAFTAVVPCRNFDSWAAVELADQHDWDTLCDVLERPDLRRDAPTTPLDDDLRDALQAWAADLTPYQVALKLQHAGLAAVPVQDSEDLWRDPQLRSRGAVVEIEHPDLGRIEYPRAPVHPGAGPAAATRAPRLGEHTRVVLGEWLGLSPEAIASFIDEGAVWASDADGE